MVSQKPKLPSQTWADGSPHCLWSFRKREQKILHCNCDDKKVRRKVHHLWFSFISFWLCFAFAFAFAFALPFFLSFFLSFSLSLSLFLSFFLMYLFIVYIWVSCLHAHQKREPNSIAEHCEPPCGCWELNSGHLEEQSVLLTPEPSLQSPILVFINMPNC